MMAIRGLRRVLQHSIYKTPFNWRRYSYTRISFVELRSFRTHSRFQKTRHRGIDIGTSVFSIEVLGLGILIIFGFFIKKSSHDDNAL